MSLQVQSGQPVSAPTPHATTSTPLSPQQADGWGDAERQPLTRDAHARSEDHGGRALSTIGLITSVANSGTSAAYEVNRHKSRSNSLEPNPPKGQGTAGTPNNHRLGLIRDLKSTTGSISSLKSTNAPYEAFLQGKGELSKTQVSETLQMERSHWKSTANYHTSEAESHRTRAQHLKFQSMTAEDTKDRQGRITETASQKRWRLRREGVAHLRQAGSHDESANKALQRLGKVEDYVSGRRKDPQVLKTAVDRRVDGTNSRINSLKGEAEGLATRIRREPFRESTLQKGGRAVIGALSTVGAAIEGYQAYRSFQQGNDVAGLLHGASALGHSILATGTFLRSPAGGITGAVLSTAGAIGAQIAERR